jgi:steroid delta-isomerase-like uncharacterized protein
MSAENKAIIRRVVDELMNKKNQALIDEFYSTDYRADTPDGSFQGRDGLRELYGLYVTAFPDFHFTIEDMIAEDDKILTYYTFTGTNNGIVLGLPPTGKQVRVKAAMITRVSHGKIMDDRFVWDSLALVTQLGLVKFEPRKTGTTA